MYRALPFRPSLLAVAIICVFPVAPANSQTANDTEQHLQRDYQGKTLLLRNFYAGRF
jgi:hypothetical protein